MPSLESLIPEIAAYQRARNLGIAEQGAALNQMGALQAILSKAREQNQLNAFRNELASGADPAEVALRYGTPKDILGHADTQARIKANQEMAASRLAQAASQWNASMALKVKGETRADALAALKQQDMAFKQQLARAAAQYNLPKEIVDQFLVSEPTAPAQATPTPPPAAAPPVAPVAAPKEAPQVPPEYVQRTTAPTEAAAMQQFKEGGGAPRTVEIGAATPSPAPATRPAPEMPTFTGSPRQIIEQQNRWRQQQGKQTLNLTGGRESVYIQRMMMGANQAAKDLANVVQLPLSASTGFFGGRKQGPGLFDAGLEVMANKATQQEAQAYNAMATGFQRSLAQIESAGLMPSGSLTHQMDAVLFKEGDTNLTKLHKLAQTRQIVEAGMETVLANPRASPEEKAKVQSIVDSVKKSVPFTHSDLIKLSEMQRTNPKTTLRDVLGKSVNEGKAKAEDFFK